MATARVPERIADLCRAFTEGLYESLGTKLHGVYLYGAVAFPETEGLGDVDFHALLHEPPTGEERRDVLALHTRLAASHPPLGAELDGYYLLLADARCLTPPKDQVRPGVVDESWALHCAHLRAGRSIVLRGPDPKDVVPAPTWDDLAVALRGELDYVTSHLDRYPAYSMLNLCRLACSFETRDVVQSKVGAAAWARKALPNWEAVIERALCSYAESRTPDEQASLRRDARALHAIVRARIDSA